MTWALRRICIRVTSSSSLVAGTGLQAQHSEQGLLGPSPTGPRSARLCPPRRPLSRSMHQVSRCPTVTHKLVAP